MRKEYGKALRALFAAEMKTRFPQFDATKVKSQYLFPGERAFCWNPREPIRCWVVLKPNLKGHESFTVEIGWSKRGRFPELGMRPSLHAPREGHSEFTQPEYFCRLGKDRLGDDYWWEVEPFEWNPTADRFLAAIQKQLEPIPTDQAVARVSPQVTDAIGCLATVGLPYLEDFVAHCAD
jgi:hypothetical protein